MRVNNFSTFTQHHTLERSSTWKLLLVSLQSLLHVLVHISELNIGKEIYLSRQLIASVMSNR